MSGVKRVKAANLFPLVSDLLEKGQSVRLSVSGDSMYPFLRDGVDSVEFSVGTFENLKRGDTVLIRRTNGYYVMHRVCRKKADCFYMVGDAQQWIEGPLYPEQLIAVVSAIWRKDHCIPCSKWWLKLLANIWLTLRPCRYFILRVYRKLRKIF
ncbi:S24/S26 family peptidase [Dehalobacter sp.]|jgi:hypothetical protein|uniref:S24/S26 family peptidase n=1 Tax=Dehalobacter sp. TaxID=1962289 RepID=UPI0002F12E95|nr:S24/S26 family peptidase [Dehalobacter sp.]MCG1024351.1 S24/S26 family peptidase [Dehalobacter sp.]